MNAQQIRFYADENVPQAIIRGLRQRGVDVTTVPEAGLMGASDEEQLAWARREGWVLFTQDTDFLRLHSAGFQHMGLVYAPQGTRISQVIYGLMLIYQALEPHEMEGHLEYI